jgi:hypothetical protein
MSEEQLQHPISPAGEAPAAAKLRAEAKENLDLIEDLRSQAAEHGNLSPEDEAVIKEWQEEDVAKNLDEAVDLDKKRAAVMAGHVAEKAFMVDAKDNTVMTHAEVAHRQENGPQAK